MTLANLLPVLVVSKGDDAVYIEVTFREKLKINNCKWPHCLACPVDIVLIYIILLIGTVAAQIYKLIPFLCEH